MKYIALVFIAFVLAGCASERPNRNIGNWDEFVDPWNGTVVHCIGYKGDANRSIWCYVVGSEKP